MSLPSLQRRSAGYRPEFEPLEDRLLLFHCLLTFSSASYSGGEGQRVNVTVVRSRFAEPAITVDVRAVGGTATAGSDFTGGSARLSWANGELGPKTFSINLLRDSAREATETIKLALQNPTGRAAIGSPSTATVSILGGSTSAVPKLSISDVRAIEGQTGERLVRAVVQMSQASRRPVTVRFATAPGSAASSRDFTAASGLLTFRPGQIRQTVLIKIKGERTAEHDERFFINLSRPTGATLADRQAIVTILNDDGEHQH
jgi:hypothetical protein